jgi:hypothetical protein
MKVTPQIETALDEYVAAFENGREVEKRACEHPRLMRNELDAAKDRFADAKWALHDALGIRSDDND